MLTLLLACRPAADDPVKDAAPESRTETGVVVLDDSQDTQSAAVERVVVIVMDGARMDESFGSGTTSNTTGEATEDFMPEVRSRLFPKGTLVLPGLSTGVTTTGPGHCDLVVGTNTPYGNYGVDAATRDAGLYRPEFPTLFEAARAQKGWSEQETHFGANAALMMGLTWSLHPRYGEAHGAEYTFIADPDNEEMPLADDLPTLEGLQEHLEAHEGRLVFWNLKNVDRTGHYGPPESYPKAVKDIDDPIADFWDWLQDSEVYGDQTVLVLTSDHGRHRFDREEDWRQHGDSCAGCREIPIFLIGPGVEEGVTVTDPVTMHDLSQTIAELMGLEMPHSTGRSLSGDGATGTLEAAVEGEHVALSTYVDGRPRIELDGEVVSAGWAEGLRSASGVDTAAFCWRQISLDDSESLPWQPRCVVDQGAGWTEVGFADEPEVSPWWTPQLEVDGEGRVWAVYADTKNGVIARPDDASKAVRLVRWSAEEGWEGMGSGANEFSLATHPSLALGEAFTWVAFASADPGTTDRTTRHVKVYKVVWNEGERPIFNKVLDTDSGGRSERPALAEVDGVVHLVHLSSREEFGNTLMHLSSPDEGETWGEPRRYDTSGTVLVHVAPVVVDGTAWWARDGGETVEVCSRAFEQQEATCTDTGAAWLRSLHVGAEGVVATVSSGDRSWSTWSP